jgi:hypothetical protein
MMVSGVLSCLNQPQTGMILWISGDLRLDLKIQTNGTVDDKPIIFLPLDYPIVLRTGTWSRISALQQNFFATNHQLGCPDLLRKLRNKAVRVSSDIGLYRDNLVPVK